MLDFTIRIGSTPTFLYFDFFFLCWPLSFPFITLFYFSTFHFAFLSLCFLSPFFTISIYFLLLNSFWIIYNYIHSLYTVRFLLISLKKTSSLPVSALFSGCLSCRSLQLLKFNFMFVSFRPSVSNRPQNINKPNKPCLLWNERVRGVPQLDTPDTADQRGRRIRRDGFESKPSHYGPFRHPPKLSTYTSLYDCNHVVSGIEINWTAMYV